MRFDLTSVRLTVDEKPGRYGITGREYDRFTGLQYSRARWYDPYLGRFVSEDPIGLNGGMNEYAYVSNDPINKSDPSGLYEEDVHYYLTYYLAKEKKGGWPAKVRFYYQVF